MLDCMFNPHRACCSPFPMIIVSFSESELCSPSLSPCSVRAGVANVYTHRVVGVGPAAGRRPEPLKMPRRKRSSIFPTMYTPCSLKSQQIHLLIVSCPTFEHKGILSVDNHVKAISIQNYIDPGAGLKHLEDWVQDSDFIFDSLFMGSTGPGGTNGFSSDVSGTQTPSHTVPIVRTYQSDAAM